MSSSPRSTGELAPDHEIAALDASDPLASFRARFALPDGVIYLDGNSLGALPRATAERLQAVVREEWGEGLIRSWNSADWFHAPRRVGGKLAGLIGARPHEVVVADSTSVNLYKLIIAALRARPGRRTVLSEPGNFPTDLYMIESALRTLGDGHRLSLVPREALASAIDDDTALLLLTHVHYKTADVWDMPALTQAAHARGAMVLWDLSHSAGAVEVDLNGAGADLAVGCGYKFLNGGPGAPAFLFVAERHLGTLETPLGGWMGHARPFDFVDGYEAGPGIVRFQCGTRPSWRWPPWSPASTCTWRRTCGPSSPSRGRWQRCSSTRSRCEARRTGSRSWGRRPGRPVEATSRSGTPRPTPSCRRSLPAA